MDESHEYNIYKRSYTQEFVLYDSIKFSKQACMVLAAGTVVTLEEVGKWLGEGMRSTSWIQVMFYL